jgi:Mitochondrial calcium uniporter
MEALDTTLQNFRVKNDKEVALIQQTLSELEVEQAKDQAEYNRLMNEVKSKASSWIKYIILIVCVQWAVLFYLTYYSVGWDVTEPIGYLIALGIETAGMIYFVKYAKAMEQRALFNSMIKKHKDRILKIKSNNPEAELDFINRRVKYMNQRILYSKST